VVIEVPDWNQPGQRRYAADVVAMPVRDHAMIDLPEAGHVHSHMGDSPGVAIAGEAGIDQQRLAGWCHDQSRGAALNINKINVECSRGGQRASSSKAGRLPSRE
jgi:hypothetical protein